MSHIQLQFGINLNLQSNYKPEVLFSQLPYLAHLDNSIFKNKIEYALNDNKVIQKFKNWQRVIFK